MPLRSLLFWGWSALSVLGHGLEGVPDHGSKVASKFRPVSKRFTTLDGLSVI